MWRPLAHNGACSLMPQCVLQPNILPASWLYIVNTARTAEKRNEGHYIELPLSVLKERYNTPELKKFLEEDILAKQKGREHPQAKNNENMRLYKVFEGQKEVSYMADEYWLDQANHVHICRLLGT